jgi:pimeloyl-ACP methyl ester carboxylesterase
MTVANPAAEGYIAQLSGEDLLIPLEWDTFLAIGPPYPETEFQRQEVTARFQRNGYDWDIHGTIYTPAREAIPGYTFVLIHGGGVNELDFQVTPDGRPGLASVLAAQGFRVLTPSYPGLWPPGGRWEKPVTQRKPFYLLDQAISEEELEDRLLKATYQVYMQGITLLVDEHLAGQKLFVMGHSTGGPMAVSLAEQVTNAEVAGIVGWASGGPDGWLLRWRQETKPQGGPLARKTGLSEITYRTVDEYRHSSEYEDIPELTPWGGLEERFELTEDTTPTFNPALQNTQHLGDPEVLDEYRKLTGLPPGEYFRHFDEPDPDLLEGIKVLLIDGENDKLHWKIGKRVEDKQEYFITKLYAEKTRGAHLVLLPKFTHMGHWALHNERIVYLWLWAVRSGYFGDLG